MIAPTFRPKDAPTRLDLPVTDLTALTIAEARDGLTARRFTATELTEAYLSAMEAARELNAYVVETPEKALTMAAASDTKIAAGEARPLEGIPLGIKDLFATEGVHTQAASHILDASSRLTNPP
ncbi:Glutamyl-tRNA(Gln) amidotransferase subunit A [Methylobrevis pamukkalensis]|uniref:Glutamyl-tRNA(Gln) amidotransferase subunit A n=1 Tax=Methylobrevis pamukkalensis TaxID=1439726 RepID=A0A1E3H8B9_9HYPH|nr:Glutamyl-tRNA(Gln) amidotransferase subunit A [Methylobrevis pamukkalensis]